MAAYLTIPPIDAGVQAAVIPLTGSTGVPVQSGSGGGSTGNYNSVQAAYNAAANDGVIKLWRDDFDESLLCNRPVTVSIIGGYDTSFASRIGKSVLLGSLTIASGTVIIDGLQLGGSSYYSTLTVSKAGPGDGIVSSTSGAVNCGGTCSGTVLNGETMILTTAPDSCSTFTGWTGSGCNGTGSCTVLLNNDAAVTASFGRIPPTVSFTSKPAPEIAPNTVRFTDTSQCADSWQWDLGDGTTSTEESPTHTYLTAGNYSVTLSVGNAGGNNVATSKKVPSFPDITPILMLILGD
jgi:hypothetical protein